MRTNLSFFRACHWLVRSAVPPAPREACRPWQSVALYYRTVSLPRRLSLLVRRGALTSMLLARPTSSSIAPITLYPQATGYPPRRLHHAPRAPPTAHPHRPPVTRTALAVAASRTHGKREGRTPASPPPAAEPLVRRRDRSAVRVRWRPSHAALGAHRRRRRSDTPGGLRRDGRATGHLRGHRVPARRQHLVARGEGPPRVARDHLALWNRGRARGLFHTCEKEGGGEGCSTPVEQREGEGLFHTGPIAKLGSLHSRSAFEKLPPTTRGFTGLTTCDTHGRRREKA